MNCSALQHITVDKGILSNHLFACDCHRFQRLGNVIVISIVLHNSVVPRCRGITKDVAKHLILIIRCSVVHSDKRQSDFRKVSTSHKRSVADRCHSFPDNNGFCTGAITERMLSNGCKSRTKVKSSCHRGVDCGQRYTVCKGIVANLLQLSVPCNFLDSCVVSKCIISDRSHTIRNCHLCICSQILFQNAVNNQEFPFHHILIRINFRCVSTPVACRLICLICVFGHDDAQRSIASVKHICTVKRS